jgi:hypothetical protein
MSYDVGRNKKSSGAAQTIQQTKNNKLGEKERII